MALSIRNQKVEKLARKLSGNTGKGMTEAIGEALEARLESLEGLAQRRLSLLTEIATVCAAAPNLDIRDAEDILGYDASGAFTGGRAAW
ncbi:MAG: type II toxin-antitoxin system VapB family antitoxin [Rectinemataceae bacterium]